MSGAVFAVSLAVVRNSLHARAGRQWNPDPVCGHKRLAAVGSVQAARLDGPLIGVRGGWVAPAQWRAMLQRLT